MKARFLALAALVLGLASCQTEPEGLGVNVGGEVDTFVTVSLPETTRANSSLGAFGNVNLGTENDTNTIRYILKIYQKVGENYVASNDRQVEYSDGQNVVFPVRLVPNRDYRFVVWADYVESKNDTDFHYNTADLANITLNGEWKPMDETRDAFTGYFDTAVEGKKYTGTSSINITLTRPFAKLRVITTDMVELGHLSIVPDNAVVCYTTQFHESFNAFNGEYGAETVSKTHTFNYKDVTSYTDQPGANKVLFTDYFFADDSDVVKFVMNVNEANGALIKSNNFNTDIAVQRNYLTTIQGNILTDGNNVNVTVDPAFENGSTWNPNEDEYDYATISSEAELLTAIEGRQGGEYIVVSDIDVTGLVASTQAVTRTSGTTTPATTPTTTTINLNGKTITVTNKTNAPFATVAAGNTLFLEGGNIVLAEGSTASFIENKGNVVLTNGTLENESNSATAAVVEGKLIVEENATVNDDNTIKVENWLADVLANGGTYVFTDNMETSKTIAVTTTKPVVINGNGKTITYTGSDRAFTVDGLETANVTLNDLTFVNSTTYCQRGINFNVAGKLTLNNVTVGMDGTPATYAINLPGSSDGAEVVINNSYLRGNIALNVWGKDMKITATDTEFVSYDNVEAENYAAISLNNDGATNIADGTVVTIEGGKIIALDENGEKVDAISNLTNTGTVNVSKSTEVIGIYSEPVAIVTYAGYDQFYSCTTLQQAINQAAKNSNATVKLIKDITLDEPVMVAENQTIVLDLNGKTINAGLKEPGRHHYAINNYGTLTLKGNGFINARGIQNFGTMTVEEGVTITNVDTNGGAAIWNEGNITINGGTFKTNESAGIGSYGNALSTIAGGKTVVNGGTFEAYSQLHYAIVNEGETTINNADVKGKHGAVSGAETNDKTTIKGGTFALFENPGVSDHCAYCVSAIYGGKFTLGNNTDSGAKVFCESTIADGYTAAKNDGWYYVVANDLYLDSVIENQDGVCYEGDAFASGYMENALWFNNYVFGGDAAIKVDGITYGAIVIENCSGEFKNDVITINNDNNSVMILQNLDFTIADGKKLIKSTNKIYQVFMANITINGVKMTNETIAKYLENVEWYQVVEEI